MTQLNLAREGELHKAEQVLNDARVAAREARYAYELEVAKLRMGIKERFAAEGVKPSTKDLDAKILMAREEEPLRTLYLTRVDKEAEVARLRVEKRHLERVVWDKL